MDTQQFEENQHTIGRYVVFMYDQDVAMYQTALESIRILTPDEALKLLEWLHQHKEVLAQNSTCSTAHRH